MNSAPAETSAQKEVKFYSRCRVGKLSKKPSGVIQLKEGPDRLYPYGLAHIYAEYGFAQLMRNHSAAIFQV